MKLEQSYQKICQSCLFFMLKIVLYFFRKQFINPDDESNINFGFLFNWRRIQHQFRIPLQLKKISLRQTTELWIVVFHANQELGWKPIFTKLYVQYYLTTYKHSMSPFLWQDWYYIVKKIKSSPTNYITLLRRSKFGVNKKRTLISVPGFVTYLPWHRSIYIKETAILKCLHRRLSKSTPKENYLFWRIAIWCRHLKWLEVLRYSSFCSESYGAKNDCCVAVTG